MARGQPGHPAAAKRYKAVPVAFVGERTLLRRDGRPGQRARGRRHRDDDRLRGPRRRSPRREDIAALISRLTRLERRRPRRPSRRSEDGDGAGRDRRPARVRRRRAGHQARQPDHRPGRRAGRLGHPLRARRTRCASASASTACCTRPTTVPRRMVAGVVSPHQDHGRPRHRRAARPAGRPRRAERSTATTSTCASSRCPSVHGESVVMRILDKAAVDHGPRHASGWRRTSATRFETRDPPALRRGARHRPDRLGQVDVALRGARRAQHAREEHHHDRGPGRVPARGHHAGAGQPARRPRPSPPACAR